MRILITGVAGFLGSHLCDRLLAEGHQVIGMDNFITGSPDNIAQHAINENFSFYKHDVSNYIYVPGKIDAVMHFASPASPNPKSPVGYFNLPIQTMKAGALGTHHTLGVAKANCAKYLLASTSEIYGDPLVHPQKEDYPGNVDPTGERAVYDEAKRFAESLTMAYHRMHKVDSRIVRIFNTYGPRMDLEDGRALPNFLKQALLGQPLTIYGDGSQTRSFCYVSDLVEGIYRLMLSDEHEPTNIGNPQEITILEFARRVRDALGATAEIIFEPLPVDDPKQRCPDITKAKKILQWEPKVGLEEGLKITFEFFRQQVAQKAVTSDK